MASSLSFQPRARLLLQLGDQLIRNEGVALLELIKNSYDAYATRVTITMTKLGDPSAGEILIEDDGIGMNADVIRKVWMQPGSDHKLKIVNSLKKRTKGSRVPIGEKGIGRFGVHKLGNFIELVSKTEGDKEIYFKIDWSLFERDTTLEKVKITLVERKAEYFTKGKSGTVIKVKKLKKKWDRSSVRDLYRSATSLSSPFGTLDTFNVFFKLDSQDWLKDLIKYEEIEDFALYHADGIIEGNAIKELNYEFRPLDGMVKLDGRNNTLTNIRMVEDAKDEGSKKKKQIEIDLGRFKIGPVIVKMAIFDLDPRVLNLGVTDKTGLKEYLSVNGGMRVFRDGIRIFNYGEKDNDWLKLDIKRVNRPGETISNNLFIGAVYIDRLKSLDLKEKTNREGFIEDDVYETFQKSISFFLDKVLTQRKIDKEKLRRVYGAASVSEPVVGKLKELRDKVSLIVPKGNKKEDLLKTIKGIEDDYKTITDIYTRSSSAGLSLSIVIHEVEKIVDELIHAVDEIPTNKYLRDLIKTLNKTVSDYASLIKQSSRTKEDLLLMLDRALSSIQFRISAHEISLICKYKERGNLNTTVRCSSNLFISSIINLIDNSIWWMNYVNRKKKKIYIDILEKEGFVSVIIADNGPGFSIPPEEAVKPFISDKPEGMGLGLHLADAMMTTLKGQLAFPQEGDLEIPDEFQKGAKVVLSFKK